MAARGREIRLDLTGSSDEAVRALLDVANAAARLDARYRDAADSVARQAQAMAAKLEQSAQQSRRSLDDVVRGLSLDKLGGLAGGSPLGSLAQQLGGVQGALTGVSTGAVAATAGVAALAAVAAKVGQVSVSSFTSAADSVQQFSNLTGKSVEESSGWALALEAVGLKTDQWLDRVRQFQTNLSQYPERAREAGVAIEYMSDGTVDAVDTMWNAIQKLHDTDDILERQRIGFRLFGESWTQLMPLIRDPAGFEELRKNFEGAITDADLDQFNEFSTSWATIQTKVKLAAAEIGSSLVPVINDLLDAVDAVLPVATNLAGVVADLVDASRAAITFEVNLAGNFIDKAKQIPILGTVVEQAANSYGYMFQELTKTDEATKSLSHSSSATAAEHRQQAIAARELAGATREAAEAQSELAQDWVQKTTSDLAATRKSLASANDALAKASKSVAQAEASAAQAIASADQSLANARQSAAKSIASAEKRIEDAHEQQAKAAEDLQKAERDAAKLLAKANEDAAQRIIDAQKRVDDARKRQADTLRANNRKMEDAEVRLLEAKQRALREDDTVEAQRIIELALRDYERTREDVADAERDAAERVQEAEQRLEDAHVEAAERRAEAEERAAEMIRTAHERVRDAAKQVQEAEEALRDAHVQAAQQIAQAEWARAVAAVNATNQINAARQAEIDAMLEVERLKNQLLANEWQRYYAQLSMVTSLAAVQRAQRAESPYSATDPRSYTMQSFTSNVPGIAPPRRAEGGPVHPYGTYLVGEGGEPEILQMGAQSGYVTPLSKLGGEMHVHIDLSNSVVASERQLAERIERAVRSAMVGAR